MNPVLLDTGCIVALMDRSEDHHSRCMEVLGELQATLITCEAVIAESCYLLRELPGAPAAVLENVERGLFHASFRLDEHAESVRRLMDRYQDVPMDLADACLVRMAELFKTARILSLDGDFEVYRWEKNRVFENLLG